MFLPLNEPDQLIELLAKGQTLSKAPTQKEILDVGGTVYGSAQDG